MSLSEEEEWNAAAAGRIGASFRSLRDKLAEVEDEGEIWGIGRSHLQGEEGERIRGIAWEVAQADAAEIDRRARRSMTHHDLSILLFQSFTDGIIFALRAMHHEEVPDA